MPPPMRRKITKDKNMDNNEQINMETPSAEPPKATPKKARRKTAQKQAGETQETVKKTARKPRTQKTTKSKTPAEGNAEQKEKTEEKQAEETIKESKAIQQQPATKEDKQEATLLAQAEQATATPSQTDNARPSEAKQEQKIPSLPSIQINNIVELAQAPMRSIVLTDQQIQQLTMEEIKKRHHFLEETLANVLDYDVVIRDTNIWLELLIGYTSSHSDPRFNARLQFERQLEFISKLTHHRGGRFLIMGETYEEIDRFAAMQDPSNHRDADFTDSVVCLNTAARLAKRLILAQQRENRLRIDGVCAESHHASFADPAIIRKVADLFAEGKKVLLLTNDASVGIRAMGICDDLQRHNNISDAEWDELYAPLRPMVFTFDDLKQLDFYTRQYHYIQMAAGAQWMEDIPHSTHRNRPAPLALWMDAFRPGDKHRGDNLFTEQEKQTQQKQKIQKQQEQQKKQLAQLEQQKKQNARNAVTLLCKQSDQRSSAPSEEPQQQKKQGQQKQQKKADPTPAASEEQPKTNNPTPLTEQTLTETPPVTTDKKDEQKPTARSRRKPQRNRRGNTEKTVEPTETTVDA